MLVRLLLYLFIDFGVLNDSGVGFIHELSPFFLIVFVAHS